MSDPQSPHLPERQRPLPPSVPDAMAALDFPVVAPTPGLSSIGWRLPPAIGFLALLFGVAGLFKASILFGPLAIGFGLLALGLRQYWYATVGIATGAAALLSSTTFWALLGLGWLVDWLIL